MKSKLSKGIIIILCANILNMTFSIMTNLILPKYLSLETYTCIKTYQLYLTYVGVLHFGFIDGIYLDYGGKDISTLDWNKVKIDISSLRIFQSLIVIIGLIISIIIKDPILAVVSFMVLPTNMLTFFKYLFQACGEYKDYSKIINMVSFATFFINFVLVFMFRLDNYIYYILGYLSINIIIWLYIEYIFQRKYKECRAPLTLFSVKELFYNMKNGILLTLGNFSSILVTSMDRWFVKLLVGTVGFAQYAFAVSMENFLNNAISPVTITLYNTLCNDHSLNTVKKYREYVILFASVIIAAAFPVEFITEIYLTKYIDSQMIIIFLFAAQLFYIIIKSIYVNLYNANKMQDKYFFKLVISVIAGFLFDCSAYYIYNVKEAYAIATLFSAIFWFIIVQFDFKNEKIDLNELLYLIVILIGFVFSGIYFKSIIGFIIYCSILLIDILIFMRQPFTNLLELFINLIKSKFQIN